jgi:hypothetical protein
VLHFSIYFSLAWIMLIKLQGYKANDDASPSAFRSLGRQKLRASDIISLISIATKLADIIAGFWSSMLAIRFAHVVWKKIRSVRPYDTDKVDKVIRWTTQYYFPPTTMGGRLFSPQAVMIRLCLLLFGLSFIGAPLIEGALDWSSSSQLGEPGAARVATGNPTAQFFRWNWPSSGNMLDRQEIAEAASLASIAWERQTASNASDTTTAGTGLENRRPCRHVTNDTPFPVGSEIHNVTIPCIVVHNITWPTGETPSYIKTILDNSTAVSASNYDPFSAGVDHPGIGVLFDPTNTTLPLPVKFGTKKINIAVIDQPSYPAPFGWSGTMATIIFLSRAYPYAPFLVDPFGYQALNNSIPNREERGHIISVRPGEAGVKPDRTYTYLTVNFTAGVRFSARGRYIKPNVIETDTEDDSDDDIVPGPWVREALYMMSDVMATVAVTNSSEMATWQNLQGYAEALIRYSYLGAWDVLQRQFDPNSTELAVTLLEPRLQANVNVARVLGWFVLNLGFTCTALSLPFLWRDEVERDDHDQSEGGESESRREGKKTGTGTKDKMQDIAELMRTVTAYEAKLEPGAVVRKGEVKGKVKEKEPDSEDDKLLAGR